jgi:N-acetylglucosaminyldiphosphoundecaprenol N-acetyl-beta-D-mannosaminyltransferase
MKLLGYIITPDYPQFPVQIKTVVNTINPHSYCVAKKDYAFKEALQQSDFLLPDGSGIVLAARVLNGKKIKKIAGADIHQYLLEQANLNYQRIFYLGASVSTLQLIEKRIHKEFPNIQVSSYSPPFKAEFSTEDTHAMIAAINTFKPDILFVGMTAPKQEKWVYAHKDQIEVNVIASIGAVFDFYAGTIQRSNQIWIALGLEWFPRLLREPKRLWRRNFVSTPRFIFDVLRIKLRLRKK